MFVNGAFKNFIDLTRNIAFKASTYFPVRLTFSPPILEIGLGTRGMALPLDSHDVDCRVQLTITAPIQPMARS